MSELLSLKDTSLLLSHETQLFLEGINLSDNSKMSFKANRLIISINNQYKLNVTTDTIFIFKGLTRYMSTVWCVENDSKEVQLHLSLGSLQYALLKEEAILF